MRHTVQAVKLVRILALVTALVIPITSRAQDADDAWRLVYTPGAGLRAEAESWIASTRARSPFSFPVVCETLGLEADAVRNALRRMRERNADR